MIKEFEFYHGAVLTKMIHYNNHNIEIKVYPSSSNASYILNDHIGFYIKHSTKRMSPWRFSFQNVHQEEILKMKKEFTEIFILLVCGTDGVVALNYNELKAILDESHQQTEWICASRTRNTEYTIKGSDGKLQYKIGKKDFPRKLFNKTSK